MVPLNTITLLDVQRHLNGLREVMKPVSVHQHYPWQLPTRTANAPDEGPP